jgi:hypothetical protein
MFNAKAAREATEVAKDAKLIELALNHISSFKDRAAEGSFKCIINAVDFHLRSKLELYGFDIEFDKLDRNKMIVSWLEPKGEKAEEVKKISEQATEELFNKFIAEIESAIISAAKNACEGISYRNAKFAKPVLREKLCNALNDSGYTVTVEDNTNLSIRW